MMKLVLFVTVITMNSVHCLTNFREKAELVDRRFDLWVTSSLYAPSVLNCARKCESSGSCLSFQFSSGSAKCRLLDTVVLHRDAGISEVGWKYYVASNRRCRDGFIDGRSVDVCFRWAGFHNLMEGKKKCVEHQSGLIVITSDQENQLFWKFIETLSAVTFPQSSYKYPYVQGHWNGSWILDDGSPLLYTNWDINNPRELEKQPYIKVTESGWRTAVNEKTRPIICSYKL
uniref:Uncharacterized protein LOC111104150 n=1 Tax=Crassostrea virginica TaxID=6565 RepID=A0A8B8AQ76_CRAVI|nr:uncharacterized protein LOC111104150 [Crassostrea virginica]